MSDKSTITVRSNLGVSNTSSAKSPTTVRTHLEVSNISLASRRHPSYWHNSRRSSQMSVSHIGSRQPEEDDRYGFHAYTKVPDNAAFLLYMAIGMADNAFSLPQVLNDGGYVCGVVGIICFGLLFLFNTHLLLDIPQLVGCDLESYTHGANLCFIPPVFILAVVLNLWLWFGYSGVTCMEMLNCFPFWRITFTPLAFNEVYPLRIATLLACLLLPFPLQLSAKRLQYAAKVTFYVGVLYMVANSVYVLATSKKHVPTYHPWPQVFSATSNICAIAEASAKAFP